MVCDNINIPEIHYRSFPTLHEQYWWTTKRFHAFESKLQYAFYNSVGNGVVLVCMSEGSTLPFSAHDLIVLFTCSSKEIGKYFLLSSCWLNIQCMCFKESLQCAAIERYGQVQKKWSIISKRYCSMLRCTGNGVVLVCINLTNSTPPPHCQNEPWSHYGLFFFWTRPTAFALDLLVNWWNVLVQPCQIRKATCLLWYRDLS